MSPLLLYMFMPEIYRMETHTPLPPPHPSHLTTTMCVGVRFVSLQCVLLPWRGSPNQTASHTKPGTAQPFRGGWGEIALDRLCMDGGCGAWILGKGSYME
jgi:hypothetical protein